MATRRTSVRLDVGNLHLFRSLPASSLPPPYRQVGIPGLKEKGFWPGHPPHMLQQDLLQLKCWENPRMQDSIWHIVGDEPWPMQRLEGKIFVLPKAPYHLGITAERAKLVTQPHHWLGPSYEKMVKAMEKEDTQPDLELMEHDVFTPDGYN
ncbi:hypothetical protein DUI87_14975 [Hirundo rustica rustica]|uniref:Uncharacterized protein n=1 Tax=Hirundo rustica rustica TaxID=333673 RepID=A0A3M0K6A6_HIRRU|nr:hypothetical protein DUI87_14975 [Hirundo rustica rustica]